MNDRRPTRLATFSFLAVAAIAAAAAAIAAAPQARDGQTAPASGTARLRGVTIDARTRQPIRRVIVTIAGSVPARSAISDDAGRFEFASLPAGRYTVTAAKPAYLSAAYGTSRPGRPGTPLLLTDGGALDVTLSMSRGGVIAGTIRDAHGAPLVSARVQAFDVHALASPLPQGRGDAYAIDPPMTSTTDDRGNYRIYGLPPATYVVAVVPTGIASSLPPTERRSTEDVDAVFASLGQRGIGGAAAPSLTAGTPASAPVSPPPAPTYGVAGIFYPGTARYADAASIPIDVGDERAGTDFVAPLLRSVAIEGVVQGGVANLAATDLEIDGPLRVSGLMGRPLLSQRPDAQGHFKYTGITPGDYVIRARASSSGTALSSTAGRSGVVRMDSSGAPLRGGGPGVNDWLYATVTVTVDDRDVTGVALPLGPGGTFSGRVVFAGAAEPPASHMSEIVLLLGTKDGSSMSMSNGTVIGNAMASVPSPRIGADGTFSVVGMIPGDYQLRLVLPPAISAGWRVRSAMVGDVDVLDAGITCRSGVDAGGAVITLTDQHTELTGALQDKAGRPVLEDYVVVFPADRRMWTPASRRIAAVRPDTNGVFTAKDLPAGDYLIAALTDVAPDEWKDPAFLAQLVAAAVPVTIKDGETTRQDLRIGG